MSRKHKTMLNKRSIWRMW